MKLAYKRLGGGPPLIILHGLYGSGDNWYTVGKQLSERFEVYLIDQRNHGQSPHSNDHTYESMQKDLLEFFESHKINKAILMGHSMGGKTAMLFSIKYPERVQKLIIVDIGPKEYKNLADYQSLAIQHLNILHAFKSVDLTKSFSRKEIEKEFLRFVPDTATRNFLLKNLKRVNNKEFQWIFNLDAIGDFLPRMLDGLDITKFKPDKSILNFQTLFIKGENSNYILEEDKSQIKELFPGAEFVTIFNAGHMPHIEQQKLFVESVKFFLEN